MTRRQDNPILLWLIAEGEWYCHGDGASYWDGAYDTLTDFQYVCRWLDAEDEWIQEVYRLLPLDEHKAAYRAWDDWRHARMAEAGVA